MRQVRRGLLQPVYGGPSRTQEEMSLMRETFWVLEFERGNWVSVHDCEVCLSMQLAGQVCRSDGLSWACQAQAAGLQLLLSDLSLRLQSDLQILDEWTCQTHGNPMPVCYNGMLDLPDSNETEIRAPSQLWERSRPEERSEIAKEKKEEAQAELILNLNNLINLLKCSGL